MSIIKRTADLVYTFRFLTLLVTPFEKTEAYKKGIIDEKGKRRKDYSVSTMQGRQDLKDYYTPFHRLVFNIKRLIPAGRIGTYAAALYLIKEKFGVSENKLVEGLKKAGVDVTDLIAEENQWFVLPNGELSPGVYTLKYERIVDNVAAPEVNPKDRIMVIECAPIGDFFGVNIYEALHMRTKQKIYITSHEIFK